MIWLAKCKIGCIAVRKASSNFLQASVESLVRSVPAWINSSQRDYTGYWVHHWREEKYFTKQEQRSSWREGCQLSKCHLRKQPEQFCHKLKFTNESVLLQSRISKMDFKVGLCCGIQVKITGSSQFSMEIFTTENSLSFCILAQLLNIVILLHLLPWHFF